MSKSCNHQFTVADLEESVAGSEPLPLNSFKIQKMVIFGVYNHPFWSEKGKHLIVPLPFEFLWIRL